MTIYKKTLLLIMVTLMTGCADKYSTLGDKIYLDSKTGKPLVVPNDLSKDNLSKYYDVPKVKGKKHVSIKPPV